jgi:hypothetical protein
MSLEAMDPGKLQTAIDDAGAKWTAGVTSVSQLSPTDKRKILGVTFPPNYSQKVAAAGKGGARAKAGPIPQLSTSQT